MNKEEEIITLAQLLHNRYRNEDTYCKDINECKDCDCTSKALAEVLYNAGYRKTFTSDLASDTQKAYKDGYNQGVSDGREDFEHLKQRNKELYEESERFESNMKSVLEIEKRNAVKEFAQKLKEKFGDYEVWHYDGENEAWHDLQSEIDECVKEYENVEN